MKLVILDRDGVVNRDSAEYVKSPDEWIALPGSLPAIARLSRAGWKVVIASNQSGLARGLFDMAALNAMHVKLRRELAAEGGAVDAAALADQVLRRDSDDSRLVNFSTAADGVIHLDCTYLSLEQTIDAVLDLVPVR